MSATRSGKDPERVVVVSLHIFIYHDSKKDVVSTNFGRRKIAQKNFKRNGIL